MSKRQNPPPNTARRLSQQAARADRLLVAPPAGGATTLEQRPACRTHSRLFAEAIRQEPNNVRTYVMFARAYAEKFDFGSMERTHEMLVRRAPRHPGVHHYIGETYGLAETARSGDRQFRRSGSTSRRGPADVDGAGLAIRTCPSARRGRGAHRADRAGRLRNCRWFARAGTDSAAAEAARPGRSNIPRLDLSAFRPTPNGPARPGARWPR